MDMSFERFGTEYFTGYDINQLRKWTKISVRSAGKVLTISEFSKKEIVRLYGTDPSKIDVVYPSYDRDTFHGKVPKTKQTLVRKKYGINGPYILYWGTLQPRKNLSRLIEAFSRLKETNYKLVIAGKRGWLYDQILEQTKRLKVEDRVIFTGFVPTEDLPALIKSSRVFVLPSLYEGFGIPVVEAQAVGAVVVVSRVSSLPEVVGDSGLYIEDPNSVGSIRDALAKAISLTPKERLAYIKAGKENTRRFDWNLSAQKIISILKNI